MKITIPPINRVHKRKNARKNAKSGFRFWQNSATRETGLCCQNEVSRYPSCSSRVKYPICDPSLFVTPHRRQKSWPDALLNSVSVVRSCVFYHLHQLCTSPPLWRLTPETVKLKGCFSNIIGAFSRNVLTNASCLKQHAWLFVSFSFSKYCFALGHRPVSASDGFMLTSFPIVYTSLFAFADVANR